VKATVATTRFKSQLRERFAAYPSALNPASRRKHTTIFGNTGSTGKRVVRGARQADQMREIFQMPA
jgi:hypothetical protein